MGKAKIDQDLVNATCNQINKAGDNITVSAIIQKIGGSYSTIGKMVKQWKDEKKKNESINAIEMPDAVNTAMKRATFEIFQAVSSVAGEKVQQAKKEAVNIVAEAKAELKESMQEISRLETELEQASTELKALSTIRDQQLALQAENKILEARLEDRTRESKSLKDDNKKLQAELIGLVKKKA